VGEGGVTPGQALLVIAESDDVGTALRALNPGEEVSWRVGRRQGTVRPLQPIPFGHKVALRALPAGAEVRKYGAVIGRATVAIAEGEHVHVHNLEGVRGRGDLAARAPQGGRASGATP
jgi:altronate dehydratase small subunit